MAGAERFKTAVGVVPAGLTGIEGVAEHHAAQMVGDQLGCAAVIDVVTVRIVMAWFKADDLAIQRVAVGGLAVLVVDQPRVVADGIVRIGGSCPHWRLEYPLHKFAAIHNM